MVPVPVVPDEHGTIRRRTSARGTSQRSRLLPEAACGGSKSRFENRPVLGLGRAVVLRCPDLQPPNQLAVQVPNRQLRHASSNAFIDGNAITEGAPRGNAGPTAWIRQWKGRRTAWARGDVGFPDADPPPSPLPAATLGPGVQRPCRRGGGPEGPRAGDDRSHREQSHAGGARLPGSGARRD